MDMISLDIASLSRPSLDEKDRAVLDALREGLPCVPQPYAALGATLNMTEKEIIDRLNALTQSGVIRRFGVIVRHRELGYHANAMVVWDIPDEQAAIMGARMSARPFVTLCYRRSRSLPEWPYNLYCMIHGRDRSTVQARIAELIHDCDLAQVPHAVLFSRRRFKQCGANYGSHVVSRSTPAGER